MVRSAAMHDMTFGKDLKAIARAGAGVNNIPIDRCTKEGIVVFNTPGANANGVKELAICALLLASRNIVGGIEWAKTLGGVEGGAAKAVEAGKSKFAGCELRGKTLGVIGLGAIGGMVANAADALGMNVIGHDPYLSVDAAWHISNDVTKAASYDEIYEKAGGAGTDRGTGGMVAKLQAAKLVTEAGIPMFILNGHDPEILYTLLDGGHVGTLFTAPKKA